MIYPIRPLARRIPHQRAHCLPFVSASCFACALLVLLLTGCSTVSTTTTRATATAPARSSPGTTTPTGLAGPSPVTSPLASPPQNCALTPPPQQMHLDHLGLNSDVHLFGGGPFWVYGFYYQSVLHLGPTGYKEWPLWKMVVEVGPNYTQPVTLQLRDQQTGTLAWWTDAQTPPGAYTQKLVLDPQTDNESVGNVPGEPDVPHGAPDPGWKEWGIFPLFEVAGCYALEVSWSGGSWQSIFAVGN